MAVDKCWANIDKSSGGLNTDLNIYFDENKTGANRTVKIRVASKTDGAYKDYTLVQRSKEQIIYRNSRKSKKFAKEGCDSLTEIGEELEYVVEYGTYTSLISQDDADNQALSDIDRNGQNWVNENGRCITVLWFNKERSKQFRKTDCDPDTEEGSLVTMTVEAGRFRSDKSQEDADQQADEYLEQNGPDYANANGTCKTVKWYNDEQTGRFQRTDCLVTETGTFVDYKVEAGRFSSTISKDDANRQATEALESEGSEYANEHGECVTTLWYNEEQSETFTKDDCDPGYIGEEYTYVVEAGKYTSDKSQDDANDQALADIEENGQEQANISVGCIPDPNYFVGKASARVQKNDCDPVSQEGSWVDLTEKDLDGYPDAFVSTESQPAANALAEAAMEAQKQGLANSKGTCIDKELHTGVYSEEFQKENCIDGGVGSTVEVTQDDVEGSPFTSYDSQEAADALAEAAVKAQGQAIANTRGFCTWTGTYSEEFTKDDCEEGKYGSKVTVTEQDVIGWPFTSTESLDTANALAKAAVKAQGQSIANNRGNCEDKIVYTGHYSKMFTPACESCHYADEMEVTAEMVNGGPVTSYDGQDVADNEAKRIVEEGGQAYADKNGICKPSSTEEQYENAVPEELRCNNGKSEIKQIDMNECSPTYNQERWVEGGTKVCSWNGVASADIQKKDCEAGEAAGTFVTVTQEDFKDIAGSGYPFTSFEGQTEANALAEAAMEQYGQQVANEKGSCNECFPIEEKRFYRTNCGSCLEDLVGRLVSASEVGGPFCAPEFTAETAQAEYETRAQAYVNKNGDDCTPKNTDAVWVDSDPLETKCENGVSMKKQVNTNECYGGANEQWVPGGTLTCSWTAPDSSKTYTRTCDGTGVGGTVTVNSSELPGYPFVSHVGPDDAVTLRENAFTQHGQSVAATKAGWTCTWTGVASGTYYNGNCGTCKHGTAYTVTAEMVNNGPVTSTVSQADATSKAQSILASGGQAYANKNGGCASDSTSPSWSNTGTTRCSGCTSQVQQRDTNSCSSSYNTTRYVDGGSRDCSENGNWSSWSYSCSGCTRYGERTNSCGGSDYSTSYDDENCGSWGNSVWGGSSSYTGSGEACSGTYSRYYQKNSCSGQWRYVSQSQVNGQCGYQSSWTSTKTNNVQKCKQGCTCQGTCKDPGEVSATYTSTISQKDADTQAQNKANEEAQKQANAGSCGTVYSHQASAIKTTSVRRTNCASGCTGSLVTIPASVISTQTACSQSEANSKAVSAYDAYDKQSYANSHGTCSCSKPCEFTASASVTADTSTTARLTVSIDSLVANNCSGSTKKVMVTLTYANFEYVPNNGTIVSGTNNEVMEVTFSGTGNILNAITIQRHAGYPSVKVTVSSIGGNEYCNCTGYYQNTFSL